MPKYINCVIKIKKIGERGKKYEKVISNGINQYYDSGHHGRLF